MNDADTLTRATRPTITDAELEVEVFATEHEATSAFAAVPSYGEQQAVAFVAQTAPIASQGE